MLQDFLDRTLEPPASAGAFEPMDARIVRVDVDGSIWIKRRSVVGYHGDLRFRHEPLLRAERPRLATGPIRGALGREAVPLARAEGRGRLYLADEGKFSRVIALANESMHVISTALLAFETTLEHEVGLVGAVGLLAGGLFVVTLRGTGRLAIATHGDPLTLRVSPGDRVCTDPTATVAWTPALTPHLKTDLSAGSIVAHGGGEPIQMRFEGAGHVIVSPRARPERRPASLVRSVAGRAAALV